MVLKNNHNNKHYNAETETMFTIVYWMHLAVKEYKGLLTIRTHGNECDYQYPHTNKMHRQFIQKNYSPTINFATDSRYVCVL